MDPNTGEILAMTSRPSFNVNQIDSAKPEEMKNRAIFDMVEPGSTFKIVVASAALTERVVSQKSIIYCENGAFSYGGRILRDHHGYGQMSVHDILMKSSNIGSAKMALMLGDEKFYEYVRRFGLENAPALRFQAKSRAGPSALSLGPTDDYTHADGASGGGHPCKWPWACR